MTPIYLVTSTTDGCGIAEHSRLLVQYVTQVAGAPVDIRLNAQWLDPDAFGADADLPPGIVHLNYHAGLHRSWVAEHVHALHALGHRVVITFHDTLGEHPPTDHVRQLHDAADAFIVHEPCQGLPKAHYWRQGVPVLTHPPRAHGLPQPYLGTVGHDFAWKNYDVLARATAAVGWGVCYLVPAMAEERKAMLKALNPAAIIHVGWSTEQVVQALHQCDATAFLYTCANTGTSGAIRLGIGAKKPLFALESCRQFRDLRPLNVGNAIRWVSEPHELERYLPQVPLGPFDAGIVALAAKDSWIGLAQKYLSVYRSLS